jgi:ribosome-associated protein
LFKLESLDLAKTVVDIIEDMKGTDILILDIRGISLLADYFVICTSETQRQTEATVDSIVPKAKDLGRLPRIEGQANSGWVLIDIGDVVVNVFSPVQRAHFALERLWQEAKVVVRIQ